MSTRSERIKLLIEQSGLSYQELEKTTGVKKSSLQRYASGTTQKIPLDVIEKLSKTFGVSQEYLMGWSDNQKTKSPEKKNLSEGEKAWMELYHRLSNESRQMLIDTFDVIDTLPEDQRQFVLGVIRGALTQKK